MTLYFIGLFTHNNHCYQAGDVADLDDETGQLAIRYKAAQATPPDAADTDTSAVTDSQKPADNVPSPGIAVLGLPSKQAEILNAAGVETVSQITAETLDAVPGLSKAARVSILAAVTAFQTP